MYGLSNTTVNIHGAIGDYGYTDKTGIVYGISYTRSFNKLFSIETGVSFSDDKVELNSILPGVGEKIRDGNVKVISVPFYAKITFLKYFYADGGFSVDKQTNYLNNSAVKNQSGIGGGLGIGGQYSFGPITVFINPYFRQFSLINFAGTENNDLLETGLKFGAGYNF